MSSINIVKLSSSKVQYAHKCSYKHHGIIVLAKLIIGSGHYSSQIPFTLHGQNRVFQHCLGNNHKQCSRYSFPGNICNSNEQMLVIHHIKIIEIATDFLSCLHSGINIKFRMLWCKGECVGQHTFLNIGGYCQLSGYMLLFHGYPG